MRVSTADKSKPVGVDPDTRFLSQSLDQRIAGIVEPGDAAAAAQRTPPLAVLAVDEGVGGSQLLEAAVLVRGTSAGQALAVPLVLHDLDQRLGLRPGTRVRGRHGLLGRRREYRLRPRRFPEPRS